MAIAPLATNMIRADHTRVLALFHRYKPSTAVALKTALARAICTSLEIHAEIEEEIFYPACREAGVDVDVVEKSFPEHAEIKTCIAQLRALDAGDPDRDRLFFELMNHVIHHVADEESKLLPDAERAMADRLRPLGAQMMKRRMMLHVPVLQQLAQRGIRWNPLVAGVAGTTVVLALAMMARNGRGRSA